MPLSNQFSRDLNALVSLKNEGGILDRHLKLLKHHLMKGHPFNEDSLEGLRLYMELKGMGGLSEEEHMEQVDGKVSEILGNKSSVSASAATSSAPRLPSASSSKGNSPAGWSSKVVSRSREEALHLVHGAP